ncbi:MAG: YceI family protein [Pseudomonadota bacterium]|nr:YceI family protein [Pseudomonadota bacterium]QKK05995.1 MAG: YceI family protein [Pseudomonadota bacterium]
MRRIAFLAVLLAATALPVPAAALVAVLEPPQWQLQPEDSHIIFHAKQMGAEINGKMENFTAAIAFAPDMLAQSSVTVTVPLSGLNSDYEKRDDTLKGPDWFEAEKYPAVTYSCRDFSLVSGDAAAGDYLCKGELRIRNVSKAFDLPFHLKLDGETAHMTAQTTFNRLDFDLGRGDWADSSIIAAEVMLEIAVTAKK